MKAIPSRCPGERVHPPEEIRCLTSLRGLAAMAVVLQHYSAGAQQWSGTTIPSLVPHGYMAVDFFFVLSGFIMAYTYSGPFRALGWRAYPDFAARRVARVWPLQVAVVLALCAAELGRRLAVGHPDPFGGYAAFDVVANLLMLQGFDIGRNMNGPSGTVSQELAAYLLFPVLLAAVLSRSRALTAAAVGVAVLVVVQEAVRHPGLSLASRAMTDMVPRCFAEFTLGLGVYRLYAGRHLGWIGADWCTAGLSAAAAVSLLLGCDLPAALLFPWIILAFARNEGARDEGARDQGRASRLVNARWAYSLGVVSYSLYLVHNPIRFAQFDWLETAYPDPVGAPVALCVAALGALTPLPLAWLAYRWIERPGRDLFRKPPRGRVAVPAQGARNSRRADGRGEAAYRASGS